MLTESDFPMSWMLCAFVHLWFQRIEPKEHLELTA